MTQAASLPTEQAVEPESLRQALKQWFGFDDFRPGQEAVIASVMGGQDTLTLMPTGAGKSLCYQLPAMLLPGLTLVVSPLIALMKDQYDNLPKPVYERSTFINSSLELAEVERRMADVLAGRVKLIYAAPERLRQQPFTHALVRAGLSLLVIDEVHCVSLWGHDFRPDYLFIGKALESMGRPSVLGMTATATERVQAEIGTHLGRRFHVVQTSPFRPNLFYQVLHLKQKKEKDDALVRFCREQNGSGIVYVRSRNEAERLAALLARNRVKAEYYHARLDSAERSAVQERWMLDKTRVIVATIAFGMGIDKANVRFIVHFSPPDSVESYAQESGRAGRDGRPSVCLMLSTAGDRALLGKWLRAELFDLDRLRAIYAAAQQQVRATDRPTLVNFETMLRDAGERATRDITDTDLRVGIGLMERVDLLVRHADAPATVTISVNGTMLSTPDPAFDAFCAACGLTPGERREAWLPELADSAGISPPELERKLLTWRDEGRLSLRSSAREPVIERRKPPPDTPARMVALLADYEKAQLERIDQLFGYTSGEGCRHQMLAAHLGHQIPPCGDNCDNCKSGKAKSARPRQTPAEEAAALEALLSQLLADGDALRGTLLTPRRALTIVDCVGSLPYSVTKTGVAKVLTGRDGAPFNATQVRGYGLVQGSDAHDLPKQIDALVDLGYLSADTSSGQRLIGPGSPEAVSAAAGRWAASRSLYPAREDAAARAYDRFASGEVGTWDALGAGAPPLEIEEEDDPPIPENPAQVMLECIASLPFPMGRTGVAKVLAGSGAAAVHSDRCRHYGALEMCTQAAVGEALLSLVQAGYLRQDANDGRPLLFLTPKAEIETPPPDLVQLAYKPGIGPEARRKRAEREAWRRADYEASSRLADGRTAPAGTTAEIADRAERLRLWRLGAASRAKLPPYMIFHDRVMYAMAEARISTLDDLLAIRGVGSLLVTNYGDELLAILATEPDAEASADPG
ncbi:MAG: RecQ family ATP-dependent DNA helicase [Chloroflexia bacterium]